MSIHAVITKLREAPGKNDKIAILTENKDLQFLKEYLFYTYSNHLNFFMKKIPKCNVVGNEDFKTVAESVMRNLTKRAVTGNSAKDFVVDALSKLSAENQELLSLMILKDVKAGFNISTINKVWDKLIFVSPYMRCSLEADVKLADWKWDEYSHYLQLKADGMYANVIRNRGVKVMSRQGNIFPEGVLGPELEAELASLPNECVFMGELTVVDGEGNLLDRQTGNGILNSALQGTPIPEDHLVLFDVWDMVNYSAWYKGECKVPYAERYDTLIDVIGVDEEALIKVIDTYEVGSVNEAKIICAKWMKEGKEGGVLKNSWSHWKDGTSKGQVKIKAEVEIELRAKALTEGSGKNSELFGSILAESEDGLLEANIPGFSDKDRKEIMENWETQYKDGIMTVRANALLKPGPNNKLHSLFLPRHVEWRFADKKEADNLPKIIKLFAEIGG